MGQWRSSFGNQLRIGSVLLLGFREKILNKIVSCPQHERPERSTCGFGTAQESIIDHTSVNITDVMQSALRSEIYKGAGLHACDAPGSHGLRSSHPEL